MEAFSIVGLPVSQQSACKLTLTRSLGAQAINGLNRKKPAWQCPGVPAVSMMIGMWCQRRHRRLPPRLQASSGSSSRAEGGAEQHTPSTMKELKVEVSGLVERAASLTAELDKCKACADALIKAAMLESDNILSSTAVEITRKFANNSVKPQYDPSCASAEKLKEMANDLDEKADMFRMEARVLRMLAAVSLAKDSMSGKD